MCFIFDEANQSETLWRTSHNSGFWDSRGEVHNKLRCGILRYGTVYCKVWSSIMTVRYGTVRYGGREGNARIP